LRSFVDHDPDIPAFEKPSNISRAGSDRRAKSSVDTPLRFRQSRGFVSPDVNRPPLSQRCARISAELIAVEIEQYFQRLAGPQYRAFLAGLYRLALVDDENPHDEGNTILTLTADALHSN